MIKHKAHVFMPNGSAIPFFPTFERGDNETRKFAAFSSEQMESGGVSLCISDGATPAALNAAIRHLQFHLAALTDLSKATGKEDA